MSDDFRRQLDAMMDQAKRDFADPNADYAVVAGVANVIDRYMAARADLHRLGAAAYGATQEHPGIPQPQAQPRPLTGEDQVQHEWALLRQGVPR